jgi:hypothetical protein
LIDDHCRLPAQMRNNFPVTVKNGYVTRQDMFFADEQTSQPVWGVRAATMPYLGHGESQKTIQEQVRHNFSQIRMALREYGGGAPSLHFLILNTNTSLDKQDQMVSHTTEAAQAEQVQFSRLPLNLHGTFEGASLAPDLSPHTTYTSHLYVPFNKSRSLAVATRTAELARKKNKVNVVACASGQDRTGTLKEAEAIEIIHQRHCQQSREVSRESIAELYAQGGHNAMLASFAVPGSPGNPRKLF